MRIVVEVNPTWGFLIPEDYLFRYCSFSGSPQACVPAHPLSFPLSLSWNQHACQVLYSIIESMTQTLVTRLTLRSITRAAARQVNIARAIQGELLQYEYALPVASCRLSHRPISRNDDDRVNLKNLTPKWLPWKQHLAFSQNVGLRTFSCSRNCHLSTPREWKASRENVKVDALSSWFEFKPNLFI